MLNFLNMIQLHKNLFLNVFFFCFYFFYFYFSTYFSFYIKMYNTTSINIWVIYILFFLLLYKVGVWEIDKGCFYHIKGMSDSDFMKHF